MKKINLITKKDLHFGELEFDKSQFEFPSKVRIDFAKSRISYEYETKSGENIKTNRIKRISLYGVDETVAQILESQGLEIDTVNPLEIWVENDFDKYQSFQERELVKIMEIKEFSIIPKWVNGSFRDVVLVAKNLKELSNE